MQTTVRFQDLEEPFNQHLDKVEEEAGYRPNKSEVIRNALREYLDVSDETQERGAA